jgi:hypothetical protein
MGYLIFNTDRDDEMDGLRSQMRRSYRRGNYRSYGGGSSLMRGGSEQSMREHYYKKGYEHAMEDMEDDEMEMRRRRDTMGRYI